MLQPVEPIAVLGLVLEQAFVADYYFINYMFDSCNNTYWNIFPFVWCFGQQWMLCLQLPPGFDDVDDARLLD